MPDPALMFWLSSCLACLYLTLNLFLFAGIEVTLPHFQIQKGLDHIR